MSFIETIAAKRDGRVNTKEQLKALAKGAADGTIPDYQLSAWLMAAFIKGLNPQETADLTLAMAHSGERLDLSGLPKPWLDKHSTGGVGDKTTLVVLPILAACGVTMVKMSGRGLGITGGTIDKLESIPGFRTDLTPEEMVAQAKRIGIALSGQTPRLAPADKALYALRDVTGTVASIPLITASILSKKIAGGADTVVLDVKCGSGAFMKTLPEAQALARSLVDTGKLCGLKISAVITDMDEPLGLAVGNALEVEEAVSVLSQPEAMLPRPTRRFRSLCIELAGHALEVVGRGDRVTAEESLESAAFAKFREWVSAQGGRLGEGAGQVTHTTVTHMGDSGWVERIDAAAIGQLVVDMGGGRKEKDDTIDPSVGLLLLVNVGDEVEADMPLARIVHRPGQDVSLAEAAVRAAVIVSPRRSQPSTTILDTVH
ncbi:MAG: thymidine phosphorylase [Armatimonadetes bacterium]|nr:thymidine phosphorylase [Armatimonadota bacterium]